MIGVLCMGKSELLGDYFLGKENGDSEKEDFLREFGESLRNFIKTGVENKQLEKLVAVKEKFQETFEKRFRIEEILVEISEISVKKTLELVKEKNSALENHGAVPSDGSEMLNCVSEEASKIISIELKNLLEKEFFTSIRDMAYLSHANMLYELYRKETKIRREEKEFEEVSEKCIELPMIVREINEERRMMLDALGKKMDLEEKKVEKILMSHKKYFNVYEKQDGIQISLSPVGKKFYNYRKNISRQYSNEVVEHLIYKNCDNLMEAVENYCDSGFASYVKFDNLPPEMERSLQSRYGYVMKKLRPDMDVDFIMEKHIGWRKERKYDEIDKFRIVSGWNKKDY